MNIAIEGMDGVGKSSVAELLAKSLGYEHFEQKIIDKLGMDKEFYKEFVNYVRNSNNKKMSALFFTLRCMIDNSDSFDSIVERSITSLAYYEKDNIDKKMLETILSLGVIPDLTFLLYAPPEERIKRIRKRNPYDEDLDNPEALVDGYDTMLEFLHSYNIPYVGIDTTELSLEDVVKTCHVITCAYLKTKEEERKKLLEQLNDIYGFERNEKGRNKKLCKTNMM